MFRGRKGIINFRLVIRREAYEHEKKKQLAKNKVFFLDLLSHREVMQLELMLKVNDSNTNMLSFDNKKLGVSFCSF